MHSSLGPIGVFSTYAIFSLTGLAFIYFCVPETKGLSEREKKAMFMPGGRYGRKLRDGEDVYCALSPTSSRLTQL